MESEYNSEILASHMSLAHTIDLADLPPDGHMGSRSPRWVVTSKANKTVKGEWCDIDDIMDRHSNICPEPNRC